MRGQQLNLGQPVRCVLRVSLCRERTFWGPGVAQLLHGIAEKHSLRASAQDMGMSYSKAWKIVHHAEHELGFPLVESVTGGAQGGGACLTRQAARLLPAYNAMVQELQKSQQMAFQKHLATILEEELT